MDAHAELAEDFDPDPGDLVAELDEAPPEDLADEPEGDPPPIYTGAARGGPWDGVTVTSRYPKGFLLVDMEAGQAWIYDRTETGNFVVRDDNPVPVLEDGPLNRWRAAEEPNYDILVPGMEMG